jgi:hypothetical protein
MKEGSREVVLLRLTKEDCSSIVGGGLPPDRGKHARRSYRAIRPAKVFGRPPSFSNSGYVGGYDNSQLSLPDRLLDNLLKRSGAVPK